MNASLRPTLLTRRSWLQGSALLALHACAAGGAWAFAPSRSVHAADTIVLDGALSGADALARGVGAGVRLELLRDDVAELFYGRLAPAWRASGIRGLAGLTRAAGLFLLEPLTADFGLRTVGVQRVPSAGCTVLESVCRRTQQDDRPVGMDPYRDALLTGDEVAFAWWMAPVQRPKHADVEVVAT